MAIANQSNDSGRLDTSEKLRNVPTIHSIEVRDASQFGLKFIGLSVPVFSVLGFSL